MHYVIAFVIGLVSGVMDHEAEATRTDKSDALRAINDGPCVSRVFDVDDANKTVALKCQPRG